MIASQFRMTGPTALSSVQRMAVGELITRSLPHFFNPVLHATENGLQIIADTLRFPGGTAENIAVALHRDGSVAGIVSGSDAGNVARAQLAYMQSLFRSLGVEGRKALEETLVDTTKRTQALPKESWYLAGISVSTAHLGQGLADCLMTVYYAQSPDASLYSLHVHRDNARAISFYQRHGFQFADDDGDNGERLVYLTMNRDGPGNKTESTGEGQTDE